MIDIELLKLLLDAGLLVLIWLVQLVVYPSFTYYNEDQLKQWHKNYTAKITIIVLPMMLGQLFLYMYSALYSSATLDYLMAALVIMTWVVTFVIAVPLHRKLDKMPNTVEVRKKLIRTNWIRTCLWTIIFITSYIRYA